MANRDMPGLLVPFRVSRGDEVQGIASGWLLDPTIIRRLRYQLRPISVRIGIGLGFSDAIVSNSWEMNGVPFFRAREALDSSKIKGSSSTQLKSGQPDLDPVADALLSLLDSIRATWSDQQWEAVHKYEQQGTYALAGEAIGITAQAVQQRCYRARWEDYRAGEAALVHIGVVLERLI